MPMAYDQPDNAGRMARLGIAAIVPPKKFRGPVLAAELGKLLDARQVTANCRRVADKFVGTDSLAETCELISACALVAWPGPAESSVALITTQASLLLDALL